ncbi:type II secretion system protein GspM [Pseudohaliea rubra]|uniref:General secretion pathway protein M n=1 Tax=Pseudohaliea rubra DSM 19751 TaxID=1265313 RepID=A0A095VTQ0_9GAMM|nr:type II secretion system protein GspM [Pseudohaliea rubra]KGE04740.1 General secretion pathway protein M [Pseudohaliea rubra DSM 19751]
MNWLRTHRRSAIIIGLTLLLPVYLYLAVLVKLVAMGAEDAERIGDLRPRIARLQGLIDNETALRAAAGEVGERLETLGYAPAQDATAVAASLQAEVRQLLGEAGLAVTNSQVLPTRNDDNFDLVGLKLTVSGSLAALDAALAGLQTFRPMLLVESLDTFPTRPRGRRGEQAPQQLTAVIELLALRRLQ